MLRLTDDDVRRLLSPAEARAAIAASFRCDWRASAHMPVRIQMELGRDSILLLMPASDSALRAAGIKLVFVKTGAQQRGRIRATYFLLDPSSGKVLALMDAGYLTDVRTAATSAVATDLLARRDAGALGVFGTGRQARAHFAGLRSVRRFRRFLVCGSSPAKSRRFAREMSAELGATVEPASPRELVEACDVICTCTTSTTPLFDGEWLRPGTHVNLVGTFRPDAREADDAAITRSRVIVDTYEGALAEAGDLLIPMQRGLIGREHIAADLHELVSRKKPGRRSAEEVTVFKSLGCAIEDLAVAVIVYKKAAKKPRTKDRRVARRTR